MLDIIRRQGRHSGTTIWDDILGRQSGTTIWDDILGRQKSDDKNQTTFWDDNLGKSGKSILYIIFQYLDCDLKAFMINERGKGNGLTCKLAKDFCFQLLLGLKHCHEQGIMHRDLKPQNIIINMSTLKPKLIDFGLSLMIVP